MTLHYKLFETMTASIAQQKIRIRLKAFDRRMLDLSCDKIIQTADTTSASAIGPIPLPTKRKIYCVLRSPHVDKDSREHFETRTHRRIIDIYSPSAKTIDAGSGYLCQMEPVAHYGIRKNEKNFKVEVKWTDGTKNLIKITSLNQTVTVKQK